MFWWEGDELVLSGSWWGEVVGFWVHTNEPSGSIKCAGCLVWLRSFQVRHLHCVV